MPGPRGGQPPRGGQGYPGDYRGPLTPRYSPNPDGRPDPGEIVWTWVPYEEDHSQGKDRPCLLYTSDAADERSSVDLGGRRIIKKQN